MITNDVEGSRFSTSSPSACYLFSGSCEATSHCGFDLLFPKKVASLDAFYIRINISSKKCLFSSFAHFLIRLYFYF